MNLVGRTLSKNNKIPKEGLRFMEFCSNLEYVFQVTGRLVLLLTIKYSDLIQVSYLRYIQPILFKYSRLFQ